MPTDFSGSGEGSAPPLHADAAGCAAKMSDPCAGPLLACTPLVPPGRSANTATATLATTSSAMTPAGTRILLRGRPRTAVGALGAGAAATDLGFSFTGAGGGTVVLPAIASMNSPQLAKRSD